MVKITVTLVSGKTVEFTAPAPVHTWTAPLYIEKPEGARYEVTPAAQTLLDSLYLLAASF